jgi:hypothetical protein
MPMRRTIVLCVGLGGCSGASAPVVDAPVAEVAVAKPPAATRAPAEVPTVSRTIVRGRVEAIAFRNINKAQGHYTYNVELAVRHQAIEGDVRFDRAAIPAVLTVRVDKVFFDELAETKQAVIAPQGPKQELSVERWGEYAVGGEVAIAVEFTAPTLAVVRE